MSVGQSPAWAFANPLSKVSTAFWTHAGSTATPFCSAFAKQAVSAFAFLPAASMAAGAHLLAGVAAVTNAMVSIEKISTPLKRPVPHVCVLVMTTRAAPGGGKVRDMVIASGRSTCVVVPSGELSAAKAWMMIDIVPSQSALM